MFQKKLIEFLPTIILFVVIALVSFWGYARIKQSGFKDGAASVQAKWDTQTNEWNARIDALKAEYEHKEEAHRAENRRISYELSEATRHHDVELATLRSEYEHRLRSSQTRSTIYQRQAEAGASECRDLASHASRLDESLEEGRSLVREFGAALRLRDGQVKALGDQIINDRELTK